ncbi:MAG: ferredoxin oxidoreductase [Ignisphaera sp.]|uniref:2-oxoacid oxidoreductase (ferredoxin) n=1 Tax=Ignisphaera aggregans TaxID=334771 RepID=A0A7C4JJ86_9CREN
MSSLWLRIPLTSNYAAAYAAKDVDIDVVAAYPITPQTPVVEKIAEFVANGELNAEMIHVESEHSALSACIGASATGARVFTATSAQGLELMHEMLYIASGMRLPIVMAIAARALSAPLSIWCDYSDLLATRDTSWITVVASTAQEVYDSVIQMYRVAEDPNVLLPAMVAYDGFIMSHTYEPVYVAKDRTAILEYAPKNYNRYRLNPDNPITMGAIADPNWYYEFKYQQMLAMRNAYEVLKKADEEFGKMFGRQYGFIETYKLEDADTALLTYGGLYGTVQDAVDLLRGKGIKVGAVKLRLFRPFPQSELLEAVKNLKHLIVLDRAISFGAPLEGPVAMEIITALKLKSIDLNLLNYIVGIGQRTVTEYDIVGIFEHASKLIEKGARLTESFYWGVRE